MQLTTDSKVNSVFDQYPEHVKPHMSNLRNLIIETAEASDLVEELHETLKWGEPSYVTKHGSTLRIDWKSKSPEQYAVYFKCTSRLVPTFKQVFGKKFQYEKDRAIYFDLNQDFPKEELKACINAALTYHKVKKMPLLGI